MSIGSRPCLQEVHSVHRNDIVFTGSTQYPQEVDRDPESRQCSQEVESYRKYNTIEKVDSNPGSRQCSEEVEGVPEVHRIPRW